MLILMKNFIALNVNAINCVTGKNLLEFHKTMDLDTTMYNEEFDISWDENDIIQAPEDDWIASVLGDESETIGELINE